VRNDERRRARNGRESHQKLHFLHGRPDLRAVCGVVLSRTEALRGGTQAQLHVARQRTLDVDADENGKQQWDLESGLSLVAQKSSGP
jgi:hypothetical protein